MRIHKLVFQSEAVYTQQPCWINRITSLCVNLHPIDDSELFGFLQESPTPDDTSVPADTSSTHNIYSQASQGEKTGCTTNTPLISPASLLATNSFVHLQIPSPIETGIDITQKSSQPVVSPPIQLQIPVNRANGKCLNKHRYNRDLHRGNNHSYA